MRANGHDRDNPRHNVTPLDDARKRAAARARAEKGSERDARNGGPLTLRQWITGAVLVAMALGAVASFVVPFARGTGIGGG